MPLVRAVDVSAWTGEIADSAWASMHSSGIRLAIIQGYGGGPYGTGPNPYARQQLAGARRAGLTVAGYTWPPGQWPYAWDILDDHGPFAFIALDVEAGASVSPADMYGVARLDVEPVIYASRSSWTEIMGADTRFAPLGLWDAGGRRYHGDLTWPDSLDEEWVPYGGWTHRVGWQWHGSTPLFGETVDLSVFDADWLASLEDNVHPDTKRKIDELYAWLFDPAVFTDPLGRPPGVAPATRAAWLHALFSSIDMLHHFERVNTKLDALTGQPLTGAHTHGE